MSTQLRGRSNLWRTAAILVAFAIAASLPGCGAPPVLARLVEARRLGSELHVAFTRASEAAHRAVMAASDDGSAAAAAETKSARQDVERGADALRSILQTLGYREDLGSLDEFKAAFDEYQRLDDEIVTLAVENTNVKAQRLSFGPAREAANDLRKRLDAAVRSSAKETSSAAASRALIAVLEIQALQAPHIAEANDDAMSRMEDEMKKSTAAARQALDDLRRPPSSAPAPDVAAASSALDRFLSINDELIALSRRNSNVRSLALSLGHKRTITAQCEDRLRALDEALAKHEFPATR